MGAAKHGAKQARQWGRKQQNLAALTSFFRASLARTLRTKMKSEIFGYCPSQPIPSNSRTYTPCGWGFLSLCLIAESKALRTFPGTLC